MMLAAYKEKFASSPLRSSRTLFENYRQVREISSDLLSHKIIKCLAKDAIQVCGKKLGIMKGKTLLLNKEDELDLFMDYCLFYHYGNNKNAIDRYALTRSGKLSQEEKTILVALQQAEYAFLAVEKVLPHGGVIVNNFFRKERELLIDKGLSQSTIPGVGLVTTLLRFPNFIMTTGAALPLNNVAESLLPIMDEHLKKYGPFEFMSKTHLSLLVGNIMKMCFREKVTENVTYR